MKKCKILVCLFCFWGFNSFAQSSISLGLGNSILLNSEGKLPSFRSNNIGLIFQYDKTPRWAYEIELRYSEPKYNYGDILSGFIIENPSFDHEKYNNYWIKNNKFNLSIGYNYKIYEKNKFQWRISAGPNINYNHAFDNLRSLVPVKDDIYTIGFSVLIKNYLNYKLTQNIDLQLITILNALQYYEIDSEILHINLGVRYKFKH